MEYARTITKADVRLERYKKRSRSARVRARYVFVFLLVLCAIAGWMEDTTRPYMEEYIGPVVEKIATLIENNEALQSFVEKFKIKFGLE